MESEHVKASNEHLQKDETPFTAEKTRELEVYSDEKGHLHNPEPDANLSPLQESVETATQRSWPEPTEMKSPPMQTMGHPPGYDPNRIPTSIFSTKAGSPADWSGTSNESLFSIHMGNNSFSRDYAILFGKSGELPKLEDWNGSPNPFTMPGELPRLEEWNNSNSNYRGEGKSNDFGGLPPVMEAPSPEESSVLPGQFSKKDEDVSPKFVSGQTMENHGRENLVSGEAPNLSAAKKPPLPETNYSSVNNPNSFPSPSRLSDVSRHSSSSFAFPVLASHDSTKNDSMKDVPEKLEKPEKDEQPEAQPKVQVSNETPVNVSGTGWFSCFSRWPRFC